MADRGRPASGSWTLICLCFFVSGATGLVYQVLWLRMLGLLFGHGIHAVTTVLAAFMGGLALGSFVFARRASRVRDPLRAYGWLEVGVGLYCLLLPLLFGAVARGYLALQSWLQLPHEAFSLVQFLFVAAILVIPTALMGGTLPVLSHALSRQPMPLGRTVGTVYAINTLGAMSGVLLAGYVLLPALGNRYTLLLAAGANLLVGIAAIAYSRAAGIGADDEAPGSACDVLGDGAHRSVQAWVIAAALGVSGAVSMVYEVGWTRALALTIGSSTYAFSAMLVSVLAGIALGSGIYSRVRGALARRPAEFAVLQLGIAVAVAAAVLVYDRIPDVVLMALRWSGGAPLLVTFVQIGISAAVLLPGTLLIGATFPCALALAGRMSRAGRDVGDLYGVNTLGAIAGAAIAGFALVPGLGIQRAIQVGIAANLVLAAGLLVVDRGGTGARRLVFAAGVLAAGWAAVSAIPRWDPLVMTSGPSIYGLSARRGDAADLVRGHQLLFYRDGSNGTVSVSRSGPNVFLRVNGKVDASTTVDMSTQLMLGHLPMLLHRDPREVLVIGLGSGTTTAAVTRHEAARIDVVEIERAVVAAAPFFADVLHGALDDPRVHIVVADGRNFLQTAPRRYDVIISEPSNPWIGGIASLYSVEFFRLAREKLRPGGLMVQWVETYGLSSSDLRTVINTFRSAFPAATIWSTQRSDLLIVGQVDLEPIDLPTLERRVTDRPGVRADLQRLGLSSWSGVLGYFLLDAEDARRASEAGELNTDERLVLEFSAPRSLYRPGTSTAENWALLERSRTRFDLPVTPGSRPALDRADVQYGIGVGHQMTGDEKGALVAFERALQREPGHPRAAAGAARAALSLGRPELAYSMAQLALEGLPGDAEVTRIQRAAGSRLRLLDGFSGLPPMVGPGGAVPGNR